MKIPYKQRYTFYNKELDKNRYCYQSTPNLSLKQARLQLHSSSVKETIKVRTSALIMDPTEMVHRTVAFFKGTVLDGEDDYKLYLNEIIE